MILIIVFCLFVFIILYTYLGYGILIWFLVKIKEIFKPRSKNQLQDVELLDVTLLIAAYNEENVVSQAGKYSSSTIIFDLSRPVF